MKALMNKNAQSVLDTVLDRQKQAWLDGSRPSVEELISDSSLPGDPEVLLDLLYNEIVLREELGENPSLEDYVLRYPQLHEDLKIHFEVHCAMRENLLLDTRRVRDGESLLEIEPISLEVGPKLADYEIVGELGRGGMGVVYKARHHRLKRLVALKMFQPGRMPSPRELSRFRSEAEAIARLQHSNIVQIFEVGQVEGLPFLVLELAEKGTLAQKLQELPFTPRAAAELVETLARAIQHAHEQHIVHRDLKPANVLLAKDGTPKITDFGLAKMLEEQADSPHDATRTGEPIGTPRYMAPEQAAGKQEQVGPATDVYGLGNLLYECLTGQVPFVSASVMETMQKIREDEPLSPTRLQPSIPRDLETICLHCLHKQPGRRYGSAQKLADDLRRFLNGQPIQARPTPAWERAWMWCRRRPAYATLIATGVLLVLAGVILFGIQAHFERQRIAMVREEVKVLMREGQAAAARQDERTARTKFLAALTKVLAEPALRDHELGVAGWFDHSLRQANQERWNPRHPPPLFDERRDEAFLQSVLLDPAQPEPVKAARQAIQTALSFTIPDDPAWRIEREQLILLEADWVLRDGDAVAALKLLEQPDGISSGLWHHRRADCLERLGRKAEADRERIQAEKFPPNETFAFFLSGVNRFHRQDMTGAAEDFDKVLTLEPDHFASRFFQAVCLLRLQRTGGAKVALTACIGQRPRFVWGYLFRAKACLQSGDLVSAAQDFQHGAEMNPNESARHHVDHGLDAWSKAVAKLPQGRRDGIWNEKIRTGAGVQALRDIPAFQNLDRK